MGLVSSESQTRRALRSARSVLVVLTLISLGLAAPAGHAQGSHKSDHNGDGVVDLQDLIEFSEHDLRQDWQTVDWCAWIAEPNKLHKHIEELILFIEEYFACDPLAVVNANTYPTRITWGPNGRLYVSDARLGSVFVYERIPELTPVAELKGLAQPLGVAVDAAGTLYVGVDGADRVEVYDAGGVRTATIGEGTIRMPNDLALDAAGNLYVADSRSNRIWVYDSGGAPLRSIGAGLLRFPSGIEIAGAELYVANQGSFRIRVFDLQGNLLRTFGGRVTQGSLGYKWKGKFVRLQSVGIDTAGRVHALDSHQGLVEILNPTTGAFVTWYGEKGRGPSQLELPLDIDLNGSGEAAITDAENGRITILPIP